MRKGQCLNRIGMSLDLTFITCVLTNERRLKKYRCGRVPSHPQSNIGKGKGKKAVNKDVTM